MKLLISSSCSWIEAFYFSCSLRRRFRSSIYQSLAAISLLRCFCSSEWDSRIVSLIDSSALDSVGAVLLMLSSSDRLLSISRDFGMSFNSIILTTFLDSWLTLFQILHFWQETPGLLGAVIGGAALTNVLGFESTSEFWASSCSCWFLVSGKWPSSDQFSFLFDSNSVFIKMFFGDSIAGDVRPTPISVDNLWLCVFSSTIIWSLFSLLLFWFVAITSAIWCCLRNSTSTFSGDTVFYTRLDVLGLPLRMEALDDFWPLPLPIIPASIFNGTMYLAIRYFDWDLCYCRCRPISMKCSELCMTDVDSSNWDCVVYDSR